MPYAVLLFDFFSHQYFTQLAYSIIEHITLCTDLNSAYMYLIIQHIFSSLIRRNRGALYVVTPAFALALALAYALPAWSNLCMQGLFSDTVYAVALKLHILIQGH